MKKFLVAGVFIVIALLVTYKYIYKEHRIIEEEKPVISIQSIELLHDFMEMPVNSDSLYLDKTIQVSGHVSYIDSFNVVLDDKVYCTFNSKISSVELKQKLSVKGRCIGFDDLIEEVKLDQCTIVQSTDE